MKHRRALARALIQADFLHDQCSPRAAATILQPFLDRYDPATGCTDWLVIKAATVFAATAVDDPGAQLGWALFAERNSRTELGVGDPLTLLAMATLVNVARDQDLFVEAITVCGRLTDAHTDGGEPLNAMTWRRERAVLQHRDGQCEQAHDGIAECLALSAGLPTIGDRQRAAHHALIEQTIMLPACGDSTAAVDLLRQHHTLLPPEDSPARRADEATVASVIHVLARTHPPVCVRLARNHPVGEVPDVFWTLAVRRAGHP